MNSSQEETNTWIWYITEDGEEEEDAGEEEGKVMEEERERSIPCLTTCRDGKVSLLKETMDNINDKNYWRRDSS